MTDNTDPSQQLAQYWRLLRALQQEIETIALPLTHTLSVNQEDSELADALEACAKAIKNHLAEYRLVAERKSKAIPSTSG